MRALLLACPAVLSCAAACVDEDALRHHMIDECRTSFEMPAQCGDFDNTSHAPVVAFDYEATLQVDPTKAACILRVPCDTAAEKESAFVRIDACLGVPEPSQQSSCRQACADTLDRCGGDCTDDHAVLQCMNDFESCKSQCP